MVTTETVETLEYASVYSAHHRCCARIWAASWGTGKSHVLCAIGHALVEAGNQECRSSHSPTAKAVRSQAAKSRPHLNCAMSGAKASTASAVRGPTPGMVCRQRADQVPGLSVHGGHKHHEATEQLRLLRQHVHLEARNKNIGMLRVSVFIRIRLNEIHSSRMLLTKA